MRRGIRVVAAVTTVAAVIGMFAGTTFGLSLTITIDENGHGTISQPTWSLPLYLVPGRPTLTYLLPTPVVSGDLVLYEPGIQQGTLSGISDVVRFVAEGSDTCYIEFYSKIGGADLADVGIPPLQSPNVWIQEIGLNGTTYHPLENEPGYNMAPPYNGITDDLTYRIISDAPVPEPLTIIGAFMGIGGLAGYVRRRTRSA